MKFKVENMSCMHCVNKISTQLKAMKIKKFDIDLDSKIIEIKKTKLSIEAIKKAINDIGYEFELLET